jgi:hypothetical protein
MLDKLSKLIDVRTIVTFGITATIMFLGITGALKPEDIKEVALIIFTFFFVKKADEPKL